MRAMIGRSRRDRVRHEQIRERIGVCPVLNKINSSHLRWLGHLKRMEEGRVARGCWEWIPDGNRLRGRPRKRWNDTIDETLRRYDMPNIEALRELEVFNDRTGWRNMLVALTDV